MPTKQTFIIVIVSIAVISVIGGRLYWKELQKQKSSGPVIEDQEWMRRQKEAKKVQVSANAGILELYPGLQWSDPSEFTYDGYHNGSKIETLLGETVRVATEKQLIDVEKFYQDQFIKWGWREDLNNKADGHDAITFSYFQGYKHIFVSRSIKYADSFQEGPPQCPCLTIYSVSWNIGAITLGDSTDTSDWKIYRSDKYGFEFKYPPDIEIKETLRHEQFELAFCKKTICDRFLIIDSELLAERKEGNFYHRITAPDNYPFYYYSVRIRVNQKIANQILSTFKFIE